MHRTYRRIIFLATTLVVAATATAGCSSAEVTSKPPSAEAVIAALSASQSKSGADPGGPRGTTQKNSGGSVTIAVSWESSQDATRPLTFSVVMDTHSLDLDGYDLSRLAVLRNDRGQEVKPLQWDAPSGGHHRSGVLTFPPKDGSGKPIAGGGAQAVEMVIRDVAGVKERVLRWELAG